MAAGFAPSQGCGGAAGTFLRVTAGQGLLFLCAQLPWRSHPSPVVHTPACGGWEWVWGLLFWLLRLWGGDTSQSCCLASACFHKAAKVLFGLIDHSWSSARLRWCPSTLYSLISCSGCCTHFAWRFWGTGALTTTHLSDSSSAQTWSGFLPNMQNILSVSHIMEKPKNLIYHDATFELFKRNINQLNRLFLLPSLNRLSCLNLEHLDS